MCKPQTALPHLATFPPSCLDLVNARTTAVTVIQSSLRRPACRDQHVLLQQLGQGIHMISAQVLCVHLKGGLDG